VKIRGFFRPAPERRARGALERAAALLGVIFRFEGEQLRELAVAQHDGSDCEEVAHPHCARERIVCAPNVIDVDRRHRRASHSAGLQDDHRLRAAGRAGHDNDAAACGPLDLTHEPTCQSALTARTRELGEAFGVDH
jgi:hypothetical protein